MFDSFTPIPSPNGHTEASHATKNVPLSNCARKYRPSHKDHMLESSGRKKRKANYDNWIVTVEFHEEPLTMKSRYPNGRNYAHIQCPHCPECLMLPEEFLKKCKSTVCAKHMKVCKALKNGEEIIFDPNQLEGMMSIPSVRQKIDSLANKHQIEEVLTRVQDEFGIVSSSSSSSSTCLESAIECKLQSTLKDIRAKMASSFATSETSCTVKRVADTLESVKKKNIASVMTNAKKIGKPSECSICMHNMSNILFQPCLHKCVCDECWLQNSMERCPLCRQKIDDAIMISTMSYNEQQTKADLETLSPNEASWLPPSPQLPPLQPPYE